MFKPSRPRAPFISLDDEHTNHFFTKSYIQNHLRRAGLLNKHGEILTRAEYDSKHTDVAIGRENRKKFDDVFKDVLDEMSREHWAYVRAYTENVEKKLWRQLRRIENQYRRRIQPITFRYTSDGEIQLDSIEPIIDNHSDISKTSPLSSTGKLPPVKPTKTPLHPKFSDSSHASQSIDLNAIQQQLNNIQIKLANLEEKFNTDSNKNKNDDELQRINQLIINLENSIINIQEEQKKINKKYEDDRPAKNKYIPPSKSSEIDKQQIEHLIQISNVVKELHNRISNLETSTRNVSQGLTQDAIDQAIKINEKKTIERERIIENLVRSTDDRVTQIDIKLTQLLTRLDNLPKSITYADVHQLIQNELKNIQHIQTDNNDEQNLAQEAMNKVNQLEIRLNQLLQSFPKTIPPPPPPPTVQPSVIERTVVQPLVTQGNDDSNRRSDKLIQHPNTGPSLADFELMKQRLTFIENQLRNTNDQPLLVLQEQIKDISEHLQSVQEQIEDLYKRKLDQEEIPQILLDIEQKTQTELEKQYNEIMNYVRQEPDLQTVKQLIEDSEERINRTLDELRQIIENHEDTLKNIGADLNDLNDCINQQSSTMTSEVLNKLKSERNSMITKPTSKELQAIMPFIELLPTFDMFTENEFI